MSNWLCWLRARGGLSIALAAVCLVLFARPTFAQDKGKKTIEYWKKIKAICDEGKPAEDATLDQKISAVRNVARRIDGLSARGVDEEVVEMTDKMVKVFKRAADYLDDYGDAKRGFKSGFRDGLNDNPTRAIDEAVALKKQVEDLEETMTRVRKRLESRYDVDLPALK